MAIALGECDIGAENQRLRAFAGQREFPLMKLYTCKYPNLRTPKHRPLQSVEPEAIAEDRLLKLDEIIAHDIRQQLSFLLSNSLQSLYFSVKLSVTHVAKRFLVSFKVAIIN
ncbi:MAG: hypothetical protein AAFY67_14100 [Cyanobacteria bacterium J06642_9]